MFAAHEVDVGDRLARRRTSSRSAAGRWRRMLAAPRRPRARWRTRLVARQQPALVPHHARSAGRPGFAPGPAVGRAVAAGQARAAPRLVVDDAARPRRASTATTACSTVDAPAAAARAADRCRASTAGRRRPVRRASTRALEPCDRGRRRGSRVRGDAARPGGRAAGGRTRTATPALLRRRARGRRRRRRRDDRRRPRRLPDPRRRTDAPTTTSSATACDLHVNGVPVFARGALWTPLDPVGLARPTRRPARGARARSRDAGHEHAAPPRHRRLRDRRLPRPLRRARHPRLAGLHVRQPRLPVRRRRPSAARVEARGRPRCSARLAGRPSLAVLCGNSEVEQQVAMLGLDPALVARPVLRRDRCRRWRATPGSTRSTCPSAPCGGDAARSAPTAASRTTTASAATGGRSSDARRAGVRFAAECLAFANVPDDEAVATLLPGGPATSSSTTRRWKAGVPRDAGAGWDFDDVRDHYLRCCSASTRPRCAASTTSATSSCSRAVTGEVMAEVFGEWRRAGSPCGGGLVLWLRDLVPGRRLGRARRPRRRRRSPTTTCAARSRRSPSGSTDEGLGGRRRPRRQRRPDAAARRACGSRSTATARSAVGEASEAARARPARRDGPRRRALLGRFVDAAGPTASGRPARTSSSRPSSARARDGADAALPGVPLPGRPPVRRSSRRTGSGLTACAERCPTATRRVDGPQPPPRRRRARRRPRLRPRRRRLLGRARRRAPDPAASATPRRCPTPTSRRRRRAAGSRRSDLRRPPARSR